MNISLPIIEAIAADIRLALGDDYDDETFLDTLEGETDLMEIADKVLAAMQSDEALALAIKSQEAALKRRRERIEMRPVAARKALLRLLDAAGLKKLERPLATVSRRAGSVFVAITDEAEIPSQLLAVKTTTAPDKAAIKAMLDAGETVPGAELRRGDDSVTVRVA